MNILFVTCSRIGDAVLTTPILGHIQEKFPNAKVTIAADPLVAPLFQDYPLLKEIISFKKQKNSKHWFDLWKSVVAKRWDWVIDCRGSIISYGMFTKRRTIWKSIPKDSRHKVEQICAMASIPLRNTQLWCSKEKEDIAKNYIKDDAVLAMSPAANWVGKQWPINCFIQVAEQFLQSHAQAKIAVFCAPHEKASIQSLIDLVPRDRLLTFCDGKYDLGQVGAILKYCTLFLGNDSGLMHMAAAAQIPTIGLFGPSKENNYGPWEIPGSEPKHAVVRIPMSYEELSNTPGFSHKSQDCYMTDLNVDEVWEVIEKKWKSENV